jgi:sugar phosphate isomerase/epimerase
MDGWKGVIDRLNGGADKMKAAGLRAGYHNHRAEFMPLDGKKPMELIAANTQKSVMLQLDAGTCVQSGTDPVAWINANPGRINCVHLKDWSSDRAVGFRALFGEGSCPWKEIFTAAEATGGVEFYVIEQEVSPTPMEAVEKCLANYKKLHV